MTFEPSATQRALLLEPQPFYTDRGTPIAVRQVLRALSELGWTVDVLTFPMGEPVDIPRVQLHRVGNPLGFSHVKVGFSPQKLLLDGLMAGKQWVCGDRFTLADILLYVFLEFGASVGQPLNPALANINAHLERTKARASAAA